MKRRNKGIALILCAAFNIVALSACGTPSSNTASPAPSTAAGSGTTEITVPSVSETVTPRTPAQVDLAGAAAITLSGDSVLVDGSGVEVQDNVITITGGGTYAVSGTLNEGRIIVNASGADVTLVLNGASITCSYGSPLYVYKSAATTIHLMEGTENALADGTSYTYADSLSSATEEEPNACLYSKSDLILQGSGALTVEANFNNGITGKDTLAIYDTDLTVTAVNHGINGKDSNTIDSAVISVTCGGDAIRSTNDTDPSLGWISVSNSTLTATAGEDGIQAETWAALSNGTYSITAGGGSGAALAADASAKGIKAGGTLSLSGGAYALNCSDDAIHSNGNVNISGGSFSIATGDDAVHADETLAISGGEITVLSSYEGLEGANVDISGGTMTIVSKDDGVNAAGGVDASGFGGRGMGNAFGAPAAGSGSGYNLNISGGTLSITAGGDGLDANGSLTISGGTVLVGSTGSADSALDYDGAFSLEGGTVLAVCASGMAQAPTSPAQYTMYISFNGAMQAGTYIQFASDGQEFVFQLPVPSNNILFSAPDLQSGAVYTVSYGGTYSGESNGGLCSGGTYSGGTVLTELTISDYLTTYGQVGMGGSRGGNTVGRPGMPGSFGRDGKESEYLPAPGQQPGAEEDPNAEDGTKPGGTRGF